MKSKRSRLTLAIILSYPVEYAFDAYGAQIAMRTFRNGSLNFGTSAWPLSDDGSDPNNPSPGSWANGDTTNWTFDGATGLLTSKTDAVGHSVAYTYNSFGKLATRTWARGVVTTYSYDPNTAEQTGISYSDGTAGLTYTFDRLGHGSSIVQAYSGFSLTTGLQYNVPGKLTQETFDSTYFAGRQLVYQLDSTNAGTLGRTIGYEMGTSSNPTLDQGASFAYDTVGRLDAVGFAGSTTFNYAFVPNSNLIYSIADSTDGWSQARTWDAHRDLLDTIQTADGGTTEGSFTYTYDSLGRRTTKLETGALFSRYPAAGLVDAFTYDSRSEVTADQAYQSNNPSSLTTPVLGRGFSYAYDPIGNRTTSSIDSQQVSYTSNALNQISNRVVPGYYAVSGLAPSGATITLNGSAIPSGQIDGQYFLQNVSASNTSSPLWLTANVSSNLGGSLTANAFLPQTPETSTYDADGNLLTDGRWNYFWDGENRLKAIETFGNQAGNSTAIWNSGVPRVHIDFKYDYMGRRISKAISNWNGSAFAAASEIRFVYENWNPVSDYAVSGSSLSLTHSYLWGIDLSGNRNKAGGIGGLLAIAASGAIEIPIYDANGNVEGLTDRSTSQLTAEYEYSPFGETLRASGPYALTNCFRFSSKYDDLETGLIYYGKRYYNATIGRFIGRDPIGEKGGLHIYAFVGNNPISLWDFLGNNPPLGYFPGYGQFYGFTATDYIPPPASQVRPFAPTDDASYRFANDPMVQQGAIDAAIGLVGVVTVLSGGADLAAASPFLTSISFSASGTQLVRGTITMGLGNSANGQLINSIPTDPVSILAQLATQVTGTPYDVSAGLGTSATALSADLLSAGSILNSVPSPLNLIGTAVSLLVDAKNASDALAAAAANPAIVLPAVTVSATGGKTQGGNGTQSGSSSNDQNLPKTANLGSQDQLFNEVSDGSQLLPSSGNPVDHSYNPLVIHDHGQQ